MSIVYSDLQKKQVGYNKGKRGAILSSQRKTRITIYIDDDILYNQEPLDYGPINWQKDQVTL